MPEAHKFDRKSFRVKEGEKLDLKKRSTKPGDELAEKELGLVALQSDNQRLQKMQELLYADANRSLLIILQGMDAAGKDGTIDHVMHGVNAQGCRVHSFKAPNEEEVKYHFLRRPTRCLPAKGMIAIFNRSYYEEVLVVRVHPEFLAPQRLPPLKKGALWEQRFEEIQAFEKMLHNQGTQVLKFFLHLSRKEQQERLLARLKDPSKHWKFNDGDLAERKLWEQYQKCYEEALTATSTQKAPWYVIPADSKWYARAAIADIIVSHLEDMDLKYPSSTATPLQIQNWIAELENDS